MFLRILHLFAVGLHTCTAVARSLCVSWAFLYVMQSVTVSIVLARSGLLYVDVSLRNYYPGILLSHLRCSVLCPSVAVVPLVHCNHSATCATAAAATAAAAAVGHVTVGARCAAWLRAARCTDVSSLYS